MRSDDFILLHLAFSKKMVLSHSFVACGSMCVMKNMRTSSAVAATLTPSTTFNDEKQTENR